MITYFEAVIESLSVHYIGNASKNEPCLFSNEPVNLHDENLRSLMLQYFIQPFEKVGETYCFSHTGNLQLNEVFYYSKEVFHNRIDFHEATTSIAKHLYSNSTHPNIKPGELYVARFKNILFDGVERDAIGIFKSETKETYLKVQNDGNVFQLNYEQNAINIKKLDKGCLIFNMEEDDGYKVVVVDQTNKSGEALYWIDLFLQLKLRNDEFAQTNTMLTVYKNFISEGVNKEIELTKPEKIDLLNRSLKYFKEKDQFDLTEFSSEVIGHEHGIKMFRQYKNDYEQTYQTDIDDQFAISSMAVKKQSRIYKSVLKLDRNFHIYIHGNSELIEKGTDDDGRKYYKIYYQEES